MISGTESGISSIHQQDENDRLHSPSKGRVYHSPVRLSAGGCPYFRMYVRYIGWSDSPATDSRLVILVTKMAAAATGGPLQARPPMSIESPMAAKEVPCQRVEKVNWMRKNGGTFFSGNSHFIDIASWSKMYHTDIRHRRSTQRCYPRVEVYAGQHWPLVSSEAPPPSSVLCVGVDQGRLPGLR
jgi:hypothetical protein